MHGNATIGGGFLTFLEVVAHIASSAFKKGQHEELLIINLENNLKLQTKRASEILIGAFGRRKKPIRVNKLIKTIQGTRIVKVDDVKYGFAAMKQRGARLHKQNKVIN